MWIAWRNSTEDAIKSSRLLQSVTTLTDYTKTNIVTKVWTEQQSPASHFVFLFSGLGMALPYIPVSDITVRPSNFCIRRDQNEAPKSLPGYFNFDSSQFYLLIFLGELSMYIYHCVNSVVQFCDLLVVRLLVIEPAEVGSTFSLEIWLSRLVGMRDPRMNRWVAHTIAILILDFMKFEVSG